MRGYWDLRKDDQSWQIPKVIPQDLSVVGREVEIWGGEWYKIRVPSEAIGNPRKFNEPAHL